jgi:hypothetical protein
MSDKKDKTDSEEKLDAHVAQSAEHVTEQLVAMQPHLRRELPRTRQAKTFAFRVADSKGFVTVGEYDDGTPGELFLQIAKQGSTLGGIMDAFAISVSHGLQYGVPLKSYVKAFINTSFAPAGVTDDTEIKMASSLVDYIFRRLAKTYLSIDDQLELGLVSLDDIEAEAMDNQASLLEEKVVPAKPSQPTISTEINLPIDSAKKQDDSISTMEQLFPHLRQRHFVTVAETLHNGLVVATFVPHVVPLPDVHKS